jgi:hypothetical protein
LSYLWNDYSQFFISATAERFKEAEADSTYDYYTYGLTFALDDGARADHENLQISVGYRVTN